MNKRMLARLSRVRQQALHTPLSAFIGGNLPALLRVLGQGPVAATEEDVDIIDNALKRYKETESGRSDGKSSRPKIGNKFE